LKDEKKNPDCPSCGSKNTCIIFWGYPSDMEWYLDAVAKKEIAPGGCTISDNDPNWECSDCKHRWGKKEGYDEEWEILYDEDYPYTESGY